MFEDELKRSVEKIFGLPATYQAPDEDAKEQERVFIQVDKANVTIKEKRQRAHVQGRLGIVAQSDKMPFGFMAKAIAQNYIESEKYFFYDFEENQLIYQNLIKRTVSFDYFYDSQYNPAVGIINQVTTSVEVES